MRRQKRGGDTSEYDAPEHRYRQNVFMYLLRSGRAVAAKDNMLDLVEDAAAGLE